ncbi:uncharacterized protein LOC114355983 [Ostrinia furnacalis]|uniref:uncharacterized protein LOC114355983 n=1 Tax=Ostrinia furnacalis TaxID=93504 RepID=UPI001039A017|nr:uncharacterized protein LOC114355983 [Ostrinia furnacalis]
MEDIVSLFKGEDPEVIPVFVARDLEKLPPVTFDHLDVTKLLKDLLIVQKEINDIKMSYVTLDQLDEAKKEFRKCQAASCSSLSPPRYRNLNVNTRRGAYMDSGPMGFSHFDMTVASNNNNTNSSNVLDSSSPKENRSFLASLKCQQSKMDKNIPTSEQAAGAVINESSECVRTGRETGSLSLCEPFERQLFEPPNEAVTFNNKQPDMERSFAEALKTNTEWKVVKRKKPRINYRYHGKVGICNVNQGKFRAADTKVPIFISRVHKETTEFDITEYIRKKTHEDVKLEKIILNKEKNYNAYKFYISELKLPLFLDDKLWPQGIIFRRFVHYKEKLVKDDKNASGLVKH